MTKIKSTKLIAIILVIIIPAITFIAFHPRLPFYKMVLNGHCPITQSEGNKSFYSQIYEDYILAQVFSEVEKGTYIDVGASDPNHGSVTKYFYLKGWRGINIEPMEQMHTLLLQNRPEDINLKIGISDQAGDMDFYQVLGSSGLSTFARANASSAIDNGLGVRTSKVAVTTLNNVLKDHHMSVINFMTIDVEGSEEEVLRGLDLSKFRPQVFVIEAILPLTSEPTTENTVFAHHKWEPILLQNGYSFKIFDGLNRYYLSNESQALEKNFARAKDCVDAHRNSL